MQLKSKGDYNYPLCHIHLCFFFKSLGGQVIKAVQSCFVKLS